MSSVVANFPRWCKSASTFAAALIAGATVAVLSGCSSASQATRSVMPELQVVHVNPAVVNTAAEAMVGAHEGDFALMGLGDSMRPVYVPGTVVVVHPTSFFMLRTGDAVVYVNRRGHHVAHVLVEESTAGWVSRGLNNPEPDEERVTTSNLVGLIRCAFVPDPSVPTLGEHSFAAAIEGGAPAVALLH